MSGIKSAKLFAQTAILRRRILLRQMIWRALAGALGLFALVVSAGFLTYAALLALIPPMGELHAVLIISVVYLALAVLLIAFTLHEPRSPELDALAEIEAAALDATMAENQDVFEAVGSAGNHLHDIGQTITLGLGLLSALRTLMASLKTKKVEE